MNSEIKPLIVLSLLAAATAWGQSDQISMVKCSKSTNNCPDPCCPEPPSCPPAPSCALPIPNVPSYNAPAPVSVCCPWGVWVDGSFIYWQAMEDNLQPAGSIQSSFDLTEIDLNDVTAQQTLLNMDFPFKPGFKVGLGLQFDYDNWDATAEYTWFHRSNSMSESGGNFFPYQLDTTTLLFMNVALLLVPGVSIELPIATSFSQTWQLNMDLLDAVLGRSYYVGTRLTFHPYFGARAAWIRQRLTSNYETSTPISASSIKKSHSWGVGARTGIDTNWLVGYGLRVYGNAGADLLFTEYQIAQKNNLLDIDDDGGVDSLTSLSSQSNVHAIRPHLDLELGIGWGTYLNRNKLYLDLSAGYGFQVFFDQNMFLNLAHPLSADIFDLPIPLTFAPILPIYNGNLYTQGLTIKAQLDF
jgi:hypothetical protein